MPILTLTNFLWVILDMAGLPWLVGWRLWPPALIHSSLLSRKPPPCARLSPREEWDSQAPEQRASTWHVDGTDTIQEDRISASLCQPESSWAPSRPCTCPLPGASGRSGIRRGCLPGASALVALLTAPSGGTATPTKTHPCNHPFSCSPRDGGRELAEQEGVLEGLAFPGPAGPGCAEASLCLLGTHLQVSRVF